MDNRKGRKTGPSDEDKCFKCNRGGHWYFKYIYIYFRARDCPNNRSPRKRRYSEERSKYILLNIKFFIDAEEDDLILDLVDHIHQIEEKEVQEKRKSVTVEVQKEVREIEEEVQVQKDHHQILSHPRDNTPHQNLDKNGKTHFITRNNFI